MNSKSWFIVIAWALIVLALSACAEPATQTPIPRPSATPRYIVVTSTPTFTPVPTPALTRTLVPPVSDRCNIYAVGYWEIFNNYRDYGSHVLWWEHSNPEAGGFDTEILDQGLAELDRSHYLSSFLLIRHGKLVVENYYNGADRFLSTQALSASKSFLSALVGIAIREGFIESVDQPVAELLPDRFASLGPEAQTITVQHRLTMTAGFFWPEDNGMTVNVTTNYGDWVGAVLAQPVYDVPGMHFAYNTGLTHSMSAVIAEASGMNTCEFAYTYLFDPLGITIEQWERDPQGYYYGGNMFWLTPREMAAFGQLYLNEGEWNGQQIIPAEWVRESTAYPTLGDYFFYGYWWWLDRMQGYDAFAAIGSGGQYIVVIPDLDIVVVSTSEGVISDLDVLEFMKTYIVPAAQNGD